MKEKAAKIIRVITVPPVLVSILFLVLVLTRADLFRNPFEVFFSFFCLALVPVLAYPLQPLIPKYRREKREGQRSLAFLLSFCGYLLAVITGYVVGMNARLQMIFNTYLLSVLLLILFNKVFHIRASGHACSISGPLIFLIYFTGPVSVLPCAVIFALVIWSSLILKRHKATDLLLGAAVCAAAFLIMLAVFHLGTVLK